MTPTSLFELLGAAGQDAPREKMALGQILLAEEALAEEDLEQALAHQRRTGERLGQILIAHNWADEGAVARALAAQRRLGFADLAVDPPDPEAADPALVDIYLRQRIVPWRKVGKLVCYATAEPDLAPDALAALNLPHAMAFVVVASQRQIDQALLDLLPQATAARAATLTPEAFSVRGMERARYMLVGSFGVLAVLVAVLPQLGVLLAAGALFLLNALTTITRTAACIASIRTPAQAPAQNEGAVLLAAHRPLPRLSVLIPLFDEASMLPKLVAALSATDYPRERMDVKILLEEADTATREAASALDLPPWLTVLILPDGQPRTKPRAMNLALDFCDGEVVGVLDAEDTPHPGQFRAVAEHLTTAPRDVACVQCQLSWFNARETWITRCFQIEYSIWFDVLLRGFQRLGLPIPLGGTSVYFRRTALIEAGGWDAHNVTEDADLGMRLARHGYRTDVLTSTTEEEANTRMLPWIRQRSRWLKGYVMTWLCHMRAPVRLYRELGPVGFLGLNVLFLGGAVTYLAMPLFWVAIWLSVTTGTSIFGGMLPDLAQLVLTISFVLGQAVMLGCAAMALNRRGALDLLLWIPLLPLYWTLGAVAAWKAVIEVGLAPFYWDKTRHGVSRLGQTL